MFKDDFKFFVDKYISDLSLAMQASESEAKGYMIKSAIDYDRLILTLYCRLKGIDIDLNISEERLWINQRNF